MRTILGALPSAESHIHRLHQELRAQRGTKASCQQGSLRREFQAEGVVDEGREKTDCVEERKGAPERGGLEQLVPRPHSAVSKVAGSKDS